MQPEGCPCRGWKQSVSLILQSVPFMLSGWQRAFQCSSGIPVHRQNYDHSHFHHQFKACLGHSHSLLSSPPSIWANWGWGDPSSGVPNTGECFGIHIYRLVIKLRFRATADQNSNTEGSEIKVTSVTWSVIRVQLRVGGFMPTQDLLLAWSSFWPKFLE